MYPRLVIKLNSFIHNLKAARSVLDGRGMTLTMVTKGFCALPELCRAAEPYVDGFGDSRIANLQNLPGTKSRMLIRIPMPSEATLAVRYADITLNSELAAVAALNAAAAEAGIVHNVILMTDLGDLREGYFSADDMLADATEIMGYKNIRIAGIGVNLSCFGAVIPTAAGMEELLRQAHALERLLGYELDYISGGNSSSLPLTWRGEMPAGINNLRLGESILCGRDPVTGYEFPGMRGDAFTIECEVVEQKEKPSVPAGGTGFNAFGEEPEIVDRGLRRRAILAIGRQDIAPDCVTPHDPQMLILGASSDHLLVDVHDCGRQYRVGDIVSFNAAYPSILRACTSQYVEKVII